jgi:hypothetical protein
MGKLDITKSTAAPATSVALESPVTENNTMEHILSDAKRTSITELEKEKESGPE